MVIIIFSTCNINVLYLIKIKNKKKRWIYLKEE